MCSTFREKVPIKLQHAQLREKVRQDVGLVALFSYLYGRMRRGRNTGLLEARDARLFERWYYWTEVRRLRFDDALSKICREEFFISEATAMRIIRKALADGRMVDGKRIEQPMFSGFRIKSPAKSSPGDAQMTLSFS